MALVVLSGPIAVGKTTLARGLVKHLSARNISTSGLISAEAGQRLGRADLQRRGSSAQLSGADWIIDAVHRSARDIRAGSLVIVDAVILYQHGNRAPWAQQRRQVSTEITAGAGRCATIRTVRFGAYGVRSFFLIAARPAQAATIDRALDLIDARIRGWEKASYLLIE
jgi:predicted kinase